MVLKGHRPTGAPSMKSVKRFQDFFSAMQDAKIYNPSLPLTPPGSSVRHCVHMGRFHRGGIPLAAKLDMGLGAAALRGPAAIQSVLCPADKGPNADDAKKQLVNGCLVRRPDFAKRA